MQQLRRAVLLALAALFMHTAPADEGPAGSYVGLMPCADCPGVDLRLDLFADGSFHQRSVYRDRNLSVDHVGRWRLTDGMLQLRYGDGGQRYFTYGNDRITMLDKDIWPIQSQLNYTLNRTSPTKPLEPRVTLEGHFTYLADSAQLEDCATGRHMPVAMEGEYLRLEQAWSQSGASLQQPLPVSLEAHVVERVNTEGPPRPTVIVERLIQTGSPVSCVPASRQPERIRTFELVPTEEPRSAAAPAGPAPTAPIAGPQITDTASLPSPKLHGTQWRLVRLGEADLAHVADDRTPYLMFTPSESPRVSGSTGCNRFTGGTTMSGGSVLFGGITTTRMACPNGSNIEQQFLTALNRARHWRIRGGHFELSGDDGRPVARFIAVR